MSLPRITVVMPVYHVEAYVAEAIDSVLAQTFTDFELLIIDDGGTDGSFGICAQYRDPRIRIISQTNRGLAGARNTGILHAQGDYIALLDSDDRWHPQKLALHAIHLDNNPDVDVSFCGSRLIDADGNALRQAQRPKLSGITPFDIFTRNPVGNGSVPVIRKSALARIAFAHPIERGRLCHFDESFRQSEDIELWMRLAIKGGCRFDGIEGLLTDYRIVAGGLSANIARQFESWERMVAKLRAFAPDFVDAHGAKARAYQLRYLARRAVQLGDGGFALSLMREATAAWSGLLWQEPRKTLLTLGAALIARMVSPNLTRELAARWTGGRVVA